ncbi:Variable outer membrane protein (plasmid) [Borrelia nietonii YOR]|uniref:Variable outer membrane protein n=1 Tax=Borrelia nietonii YOR TaxID=1293576 RepID=W5SB16_9SPIR|nr:Variable outer membrane protein [Borrelia nietonii YOR]
MQDKVAKNSNYVKVKTVVDKFVADVLDKITARAKEAAKRATTDAAIENTVKDQAAVAARRYKRKCTR